MLITDRANHSAAIRDFLKKQPTRLFTADQIFEGMELADKSQSICRNVLGELASGSNVVAIRNGEIWQYGAGRINGKKAETVSIPESFVPQRSIHHQLEETITPPEVDADVIKQTIVKALNNALPDDLRRGEIFDHLKAQGYVMNFDLGLILSQLAHAKTIYRTGSRSTTRYRALPYPEEKKPPAPALPASKPEKQDQPESVEYVEEPLAVQVLPPEVVKTITALRERRALIDEALTALEKIYGEWI